jgi:hypothetical protein
MLALTGQDSKTLREQIREFIASPKYERRTRPREHRGPRRQVSGKRNLYQRINPYPRIQKQQLDPWVSETYKRNINPILAPGNNQFDYRGVGHLDIAPNDPNPTGIIFNRFQGSDGMRDAPYSGALSSVRADIATREQRKDMKKLSKLLTSLTAQSRLSYTKSLVPSLHDPKEVLKLRQGGPMTLLRRADQLVRMKTGKALTAENGSLVTQQFKRGTVPGMGGVFQGHVKGQSVPRINFSVDKAGQSIGVELPSSQNPLLYSQLLSSLLKPPQGAACPAESVSDGDPCNRVTGRKLHPDKNPGCQALATSKFQAFTERCPEWLKTS